ncbi:MAG: ATP-binding protein [Acidimicrobiaceae bacterium]|nr:ATP-binding protein [Acidimicrobiaceae bacterium]
MLKEVHESWHVEYKREVNVAKVLAKSIGALANTLGGWLIISIEESDEGDGTAGEFPGLDGNQLSLLLQRLGPSINAHLQPVPHFEHRILGGPCETIGLDRDRSVVAVWVPMSMHTPHIHSDGRVYERVGDTSQPRPISERHLLDELWRRGDRVRDATQRWVQDDPEFSEDERRRPYLRLLLTPDPWNPTLSLPSLSIQRFREVVLEPVSGERRMPFDSVYSDHVGLVARQIFTNDPRELGLTLIVRKNCTCDVVIPMNIHSGGADELERSLGQGYQHAGQYTQLLRRKNYWRNGDDQPLSVVDLNHVLYVLDAIVNQYRALLGLLRTDSTFHFKARLLYASRMLPFVDVSSVLDRFDADGVPMVMHAKATIPPGHDPDSFAISESRSSPTARMPNTIRSSTDQALDVFFRIFHAIGISGIVDEPGSVDASVAQELANAAERASNRVSK